MEQEERIRCLELIWFLPPTSIEAKDGERFANALWASWPNLFPLRLQNFMGSASKRSKEELAVMWQEAGHAEFAGGLLLKPRAPFFTGSVFFPDRRAQYPTGKLVEPEREFRSAVIRMTLDCTKVANSPALIAKAKALFQEVAEGLRAHYAAAIVQRGVIKKGRSVWYDGNVEELPWPKGRELPGTAPPQTWLGWYHEDYLPLVPKAVIEQCVARPNGALMFDGGPAPMDADQLARAYPGMTHTPLPTPNRQRADARRAATEAYLAAAGGLLAELAEAGFRVADLAQLRVIGINRANVPILLRWLPRIDYAPLRLDIAQCLHVAKPRSALPILASEFERVVDSAHWNIGGAIAVIAKQRDYALLKRLVTPKRYGMGRQMMVMKLGIMKNEPCAPDLLLSLAHDQDVALHALRALGTLRDARALPTLREFLDPAFLENFTKDGIAPTGWASALRKEARKAIERIKLG